LLSGESHLSVTRGENHQASVARNCWMEAQVVLLVGDVRTCSPDYTRNFSRPSISSGERREIDAIFMVDCEADFAPLVVSDSRSVAKGDKVERQRSFQLHDRKHFFHHFRSHAISADEKRIKQGCGRLISALIKIVYKLHEFEDVHRLEYRFRYFD
jgi:hypothetical protein